VYGNDLVTFSWYFVASDIVQDVVTIVSSSPFKSLFNSLSLSAVHKFWDPTVVRFRGCKLFSNSNHTAPNTASRRATFVHSYKFLKFSAAIYQDVNSTFDFICTSSTCNVMKRKRPFPRNEENQTKLLSPYHY